MKHWRPILFFALAVAVVLAFSAAPASGRQGAAEAAPGLPDAAPPSAAPESPASSTWKGEPALDFTAELADGQSFTLSAQEGKVVLLNFWATWCPNCVGDLPTLEQLHEAYAGDDRVEIVTVNAGEDAETVKRFLSENGYTFPAALDTDSAISYAYGVTGIPATVVFRADGSLSDARRGAMAYEAFDAMVQEALGA